MTAYKLHVDSGGVSFFDTQPASVLPFDEKSDSGEDSFVFIWGIQPEDISQKGIGV